MYRYEIGAEGSKQPLSRTVGAQAERVDRGCRSTASRESCSFVYHCFEGYGSTALRLANGELKTVEWSKGDTFAVPAWTEIVHKATERSYLFAINDLPLLENLGMYRKE